MPIMRNPFRSKPNDIVQDENIRPSSNDDEYYNRADSWGSAARPSSIGTNGSRPNENQPTEYKLSEINDNGVYLPPSPSETKSSFWSSRSGASTRTSSHRSIVNENEPFSISRESFDSYRRSFDISARSPVLEGSPIRPRQSLDARQLRLPGAVTSSSPSTGAAKKKQSLGLTPPRPSNTPFQPTRRILPDNHINLPETQPEEPEEQVHSGTKDTPAKVEQPTDAMVERFEDVGLGEPADPLPPFKKQQPPQQPQKKAGIFSRFSGSSAPDGYTASGESTPTNRPGSSGLGISLGMFGRKRGTSGQGAELGSVQQPRHGHGKKDSVSSAGPTEVNDDA